MTPLPQVSRFLYSNACTDKMTLIAAQGSHIICGGVHAARHRSTHLFQIQGMGLCLCKFHVRLLCCLQSKRCSCVTCTSAEQRSLPFSISFCAGQNVLPKMTHCLGPPVRLTAKYSSVHPRMFCALSSYDCCTRCTLHLGLQS
jgi:hypothetical protein